MRWDHTGKALLSLGVNSRPASTFWARDLKGLANAAIIGQRANGFRSLLRTRTSRILRILGIIREKSMDKAPSLGLACGSLGLL